MNTHDVKSLLQQLVECDEKEKQEREYVFSRRWFLRTLTGSVAGALVLGGTDLALANNPGCNATRPNHCTGAANVCLSKDACMPNICDNAHTCGGGAAGNNTCNAVDQCLAGDNTCKWTNTCTPLHTCARGNFCGTNTCAGWNQCLADVCKVNNKCVVRDKCFHPDDCPKKNTCTTNVNCWINDTPPKS